MMIIKTQVQPIAGQNKALLTITYEDGREATAEVTQAAAVTLTEQLQRFTTRRLPTT